MIQAEDSRRSTDGYDKRHIDKCVRDAAELGRCTASHRAKTSKIADELVELLISKGYQAHRMKFLWMFKTRKIIIKW